MTIGTRSLLFGCHQFILHPLFVIVAWWKLYGPPTFVEVIAIIIHDWGYWGVKKIDGPDDRHPEFAARLFYALAWHDPLYKENPQNSQCFDAAYLCLYHSRFYAREHNRDPSKLCWADKYGVCLTPPRLWVLLGKLSGELDVYMNNPKYEQYKQDKTSGVHWHEDYVAIIMPMIEKGAKQFQC